MTVEHTTGLDTAPHMRVLCRVTAPWPAGYEPFHSIEFQPVISSKNQRWGQIRQLILHPSVCQIFCQIR
ncbi:MAG: hypothetical protein R2696_16135 [Microthrixaceae bacterium]